MLQRLRINRLAYALCAFTLGLCLTLQTVRAQSAPSTDQRALQLQVYINGKDTHLIGSFLQEDDGRLTSKAAELAALGIRAPDGTDKSAQVVLNDLPGLSYTYDESRQELHLNLRENVRLDKEYSARPEMNADELPVTNGFGALMNYDLYSTTMKPFKSGNFEQGVSASLDGRLFTPFGTLTQSAIAGSTVTNQGHLLRLESALTYSDPGTMMTYRAGDTISSGMAWTRPVRIAGLQAQRDFTLRSDLVTMPVPNLSGSSAVPTTVDVYVNDVKSFSQKVDEGPYRITNLPLVGAGAARIVVVDAAGHEVEETMPFITSPLLLRSGLSNFSLEAGFSRNYFGAKSFSYDNRPVVSASYRRGLTDWLTMESHAEGTGGLINGGLGIAAPIMGRAVLNLAASVDHSHRGNAVQPYVSLETHWREITFSAAAQRTFGHYDDLASVTARHNTTYENATANKSFSVWGLGASVLPPRELLRLSVSSPLYFDPSTIGFSITRETDPDRKRTTVASLNWSRTGPYDSSLFVSAYREISGQHSTGIFAGINIPFGDQINASAGISSDRGHVAPSFEIAKNVGTENGSYGWRLRDVENNNNSVDRRASVAYRSPYGAVEATAGQLDKNFVGSVEVKGSVATLGNGVYVSNFIQDSFAVVDAKAPNVKVYSENREIGVTGPDGKLLVPDLRSYEPNRINIDTQNLPLDASAGSTEQFVKPGNKQGIVVDFGVKTNIKGAVLIIVDNLGHPVSAGSIAKLEGTDLPFVVGYDGRTYLTDLSENNVLHVSTSQGECVVNFSYHQSDLPSQTIGPAVCH